MRVNSLLRPGRSVRRRGAITVLAAGLAVVVAGCASTATPTAAESSAQAAGPASSAAVVTIAPPQSSAPPAAVTSQPAAPATTKHAEAAADASMCGAPGNPYGYNFCGSGGYITSPPAEICTYFDCIANFFNGRGYLVECNDGTYSMSGGISGACSDHGGEQRPVENTVQAAAAPPVVHTTQPAPRPVVKSTQPAPPPPPKPSTCGAPSNPYGYNFCGKGGYVTSPPGEICSYFDCIANFFNGHGYMVECNDGTYSMSGGIRGACSYHGGEDRPVYSG